MIAARVRDGGLAPGDAGRRAADVRCARQGDGGAAVDPAARVVHRAPATRAAVAAGGHPRGPRRRDRTRLLVAVLPAPGSDARDARRSPDTPDGSRLPRSARTWSTSSPSTRSAGSFASSIGIVLLRWIWRLSVAVWRRTTGTDVAGAPVMSPREQAATWGWVLMLLMLLGPVLMPWYVTWALPLAWVLPRAARWTLLAVSALLGVTLWSTEAMRYPGAFRLNVFVGNWIVVPIIVGLLIVAPARPALTDRGRASVRGRGRARRSRRRWSSSRPREERVAEAAGQGAG